ncbi:MAG: hypothetical protein U0W24_08545 [Bacteroidales bacterium]
MIKTFFPIVFVLHFIGCKSNNTNEWFECNREKSLFTINRVIPIDIDTLKTLKDFNDFADKIDDTISGCYIQYGFIYNIENLSLTKNSDSSQNIVIPCLTAWNPNCGVEIPKPELTIYLTNADTIQIILLKKDTTELLYTENEMITQFFFNYYDEKRKTANNFNEFNNSWIHICMTDTFNFRTKFLPVFNILFKVYKKTLNQFILEKYKKTFCQLDTSLKFSMLLSKNRFRIRIDNFDERKFPIFTKKE